MNKKLIVKIEKDLLKITQAERKKEGLLITDCRTFEFSDELKKEITAAALADFLANCLRSHEFNTSNVVLLFDAKRGFFREYKHIRTSNELTEKRFYIEDDYQRGIEGGRTISERLDYPFTEDVKEMDRAAIYGIDDKFFRDLVKCLKKNNIDVLYATSSMIAFLKSMERTMEFITPETGLHDRIIGIDIHHKTFRAVVMDEDRLIHMEESSVPDDAKAEDRNLTDMLTDLLKECSPDVNNTVVLVSGDDSESMAKRLMSYSGIKCQSIIGFYDKIKEAVVLGGNLKEKRESFEDVYSIIGVDIMKDKYESYLYGGWSKRRFSRATTRICVAVTVILAILFSMLPIYTLVMMNENSNLNDEINKEIYSEQLALIRENRDVLSKLQAYKDDQAIIDESNINYSEVLALLREELLSEAVINDLFYDDESGLIVDFDVSDVSGYENALNKLNDERQILVVETATGPAISGSGQNVQIKVTIDGGGGGDSQ